MLPKLTPPSFGMRVGIILLLLALVILVTAWPFKSGDKSGERILMRDVTALTLRQGQYTTGRRTNPILQLQCVGGSACHSFTPQVAQCTQTGWDGKDAQWRCEIPHLPSEMVVSSIDVACEGYDYPDDPYILAGSCGLEYTLNYRHSSSNSSYGSSYDGTSSSWNRFLILLLVGFAVWYFCFRQPHHSYNSARTSSSSHGPSGGGGGGGGGLGGGAFNSPGPGNYDGNEQRRGGGRGGDNKNSYDYTSSSAAAGSNSGSSGGGFWTGALTGAMAGYLLGGNRRQGAFGYQPYYHQNRGYGGGYGGGGYSRGFGGGGGGGGFSSGGGTSFGGTRRR